MFIYTLGAISFWAHPAIESTNSLLICWTSLTFCVCCTSEISVFLLCSQEAMALISQRSFNPRDMFKQREQNFEASGDGRSPLSLRPGKKRHIIGRSSQKWQDTKWCMHCFTSLELREAAESLFISEINREGDPEAAMAASHCSHSSDSHVSHLTCLTSAVSITHLTCLPDTASGNNFTCPSYRYQCFFRGFFVLFFKTRQHKHTKGQKE